jgi:hypothetical protein
MKPRKIPIRTCTACRTSADKKDLLRIVRTAAGEIVVDPTGRVAGRGTYLCASKDCLKKAIKEKRISRALKVDIPEKTIMEIELAIRSAETPDDRVV